MNLFFSYSVLSDHDAVGQGYKFLGAGYDNNDSEVHVFEMKALETPIQKKAESNRDNSNTVN